MSVKGEMRALQLKQRAHDEGHHRDVFYLPYPQRMRHLVLHFAKYTGRLAAMDTSSPPNALAATLVDTFIIALSAAEMLKVDLAAALKGTVDQATTLTEAGRLIGGVNGVDQATVRDYFFRQLAQITGRMAKACESLDHMEAFDYRKVLTGGVVDAVRLCLAAASAAEVDLSCLVSERWAAIERQAIL